MGTTMHFFGMIFWLVVFWFAFRAFRRRERWAMMGPRGYAPGWYSRKPYRRGPVEYGGRKDVNGSRTSDDDRKDYIDALETRVTDLEERLDFTERLLASRQDAGSGAGSGNEAKAGSE
jgi:hypothetical protein